METKTRYLGHCPVCTAEQKLTTDMRMVHHGFQRPGDGYIHGDCFGVHYSAYELSCEGTKAYLVMVQAQQESVSARLNRLVSGQVKKLTKVVTEWRKGRMGTTRVVEVCEEEVVEFRNLLRITIAQVESELRHVGHEVARVEKLIANWAPKAVRTVEEGAREEQANKDARKAEKAAQKAKKLADKVAREAKAAALQAKRDAIMADFKSQFIALANSVESPADIKAAARNLALKMGQKKYASFMSPQDLGIGEVFVKLGLATPEGYAGVTYYKYDLAAFGY